MGVEECETKAAVQAEASPGLSLECLAQSLAAALLRCHLSHRKVMSPFPVAETLLEATSESPSRVSTLWTASRAPATTNMFLRTA